MAGQVVNFADLVKAAGDAGYQLFPKGWYDLMVDSAEGGTTGNGKPCVKLQIRVTSGPYATSTTKLRDMESITADSPGALGFFFSRMEAMGLPKSWFAQLPPMEADQLMSYVAQALVGRHFRGYVDDSRMYQDRRQNDITDFQPPGGGPSAVPQTQFGTPIAGPAPVQQFAPPAGPPVQQFPQPGSPGGLDQFVPPQQQQPAAPQFQPPAPAVQQFQQPPAFQQPPVAGVPVAPPAQQASPAQMTPPPSPFTQPASPFPAAPQMPQAAPPPPPAAQPPALPFSPQPPAQTAPQPAPPNGQPEQQQQQQQQQLPPPPPPGQMPF